MNRQIALSLTAIAATAALSFGSASSAAAPTSSYVITGVKSIGGYRVGAPYSAARRAFDVQFSSSQDPTTCVAQWPKGLTIAWHRRLPYVKWQKACVKFYWAKVAGTAWRTDRGLKVGASVPGLRSLYPSATRKTSRAYAVWTLVRGSGVSLQAWTKKGRVVYFRLAGS